MTRTGYEVYQGSAPFVFVSYARKDLGRGVSHDIKWLYEIGHRVWFDSGIGPGSRWDNVLAERIESCGCFFLFLSRHSAKSKYVLQEVKHALKHEKPIMPIYLEDVELPSELNDLLEYIQRVDRYALSQREYRISLGEHIDAETLAIQALPPPFPSGSVVDCTDEPKDTRIGVPTDHVWYLIVDSEALGPMTTQEARGWISKRRDCRLLIQQPGMEDWLHPDQLQVFR